MPVPVIEHETAQTTNEAARCKEEAEHQQRIAKVAKRRRRERCKRTTRAIVESLAALATVVIAVLTGAYVVYSGRQWQETRKAAGAAKMSADAAQTQASLMRTQMEMQARPRIIVDKVRADPESTKLDVARPPDFVPAPGPDLRVVEFIGINNGGDAYELTGEAFWAYVATDLADVPELTPSSGQDFYSPITVKKSTAKKGDEVTGLSYMLYRTWREIELRGIGAIAIYGWFEHCDALNKRRRDPFCWVFFLRPEMRQAGSGRCTAIPEALFTEPPNGECR